MRAGGLSPCLDPRWHVSVTLSTWVFPVSLLRHPQLCLEGMQCAECADLKRLLLPLTAHVPACFLQHLPPHVQIQTPDNVTLLASWAGLCMLGEMLALKNGCGSVRFFR